MNEELDQKIGLQQKEVQIEKDKEEWSLRKRVLFCVMVSCGFLMFVMPDYNSFSWMGIICLFTALACANADDPIEKAIKNMHKAQMKDPKL